MARSFSANFNWGIGSRNNEHAPAIPSSSALQDIASDTRLSLTAFNIIEHVDERAHNGSGGHDTQAAATIVTDLALGLNHGTRVLLVGEQRYNGQRMLCSIVELDANHYFFAVNSGPKNDGTIFEVEGYTSSGSVAKEKQVDIKIGKDAKQVLEQIRQKLLN